MDTENQFQPLIADRYEVISTIGEGGMGVVYKVRDPELDRTVAVKTMTASAGADEFERFVREGQVLSAFRHKNIINFYRFGRSKTGQPFIVMEYIDAPDLSTLIRANGRLDWQRSVDICLQVCRGMEYAHRQGVISRDLKPQNILVLDDGGKDLVKIIDFGLAKRTCGEAESQRLTETGFIVGSVHYISPEQVKGTASDGRADVYSLGSILYEMLTGCVPLAGMSHVEILKRQLTEYPKQPSRLLPKGALPNSLERIVFKALQKQAALRYQSMTEFADDLEHVRNGQPGKLAAISNWRNASGSDSITNLRGPVICALVCSVLLVCTGFLYWRTSLPSREKADLCFTKAQFHEKETRLEEALANYQEGIKAAPPDYAPLKLFSPVRHAYLCAAELKNHGAARELLEKAARLLYLQRLHNMANAPSGAEEEATEQLRTALEFADRNPGAQSETGKLLELYNRLSSSSDHTDAVFPWKLATLYLHRQASELKASENAEVRDELIKDNMRFGTYVNGSNEKAVLEARSDIVEALEKARLSDDDAPDLAVAVCRVSSQLDHLGKSKSASDLINATIEKWQVLKFPHDSDYLNVLGACAQLNPEAAVALLCKERNDRAASDPGYSMALRLCLAEAKMREDKVCDARSEAESVQKDAEADLKKYARQWQTASLLIASAYEANMNLVEGQSTIYAIVDKWLGEGWRTNPQFLRLFDHLCNGSVDDKKLEAFLDRVRSESTRRPVPDELLVKKCHQIGALVCNRAGDYPAALEHASKFISIIRSRSPLVPEELGMMTAEKAYALSKLGRNKEARTLLCDCLSEWDRNAWGHRHFYIMLVARLAQLRFLEKDYKNIDSLIQRLDSIPPTTRDSAPAALICYRIKALLSREHGNIRQAKDELEKETELANKFSDPCLLHAEVDWMLKIPRAQLHLK